MKKIFSIFLLSSLIFAIGCENEDDPRFQDNPETGWIEFPSASTSIALAEGDDPIAIPINFTAPINLSDVDLTFSITAIAGDYTAVFDVANSIKIEGNTNTNNIILNPNVFSVLNLVTGGDVVFDITVASATRGIPIGLSDGSAFTTHRVSVTCGSEPTPPPPGNYLVAFFDSWGDGWQTNTSSGGNGITLTMSDANGDTTIVEVGMCSQYGTPTGTFLDSGDCTVGDGSFALTQITVPEGMVSGDWYFPGDWFDEIGFIILWEGTQVYTTGSFGVVDEGPIIPNFCN